MRRPRFSTSASLQPRASSLQSPACGFTLLEVIVAFAIMGLVSAIVFSSFRLAVNSYIKSQERLQEKAQERALQDQIRRQVGSLFPLRPTAGFVQEVATEGSQEPADPIMHSQIPLFYGARDFVTFITIAPLLFQETPGLTVVRYGLARGEGGSNSLGLMETPFVGLGSYNMMVRGGSGPPLPLITHVASLQFEYYGYDSQSETYHWYDSWNGEEMHAVPSAIRIRYNEKSLLIPVNATFSGGVLGIQGLIR